MRHPLLVALAATVALTACGSTVQVQGQALEGVQVQGDGLASVSGSTGTLTTQAPPAGAGSPAVGSAASPGGASDPVAGSAPSGATAVGPTAAPTGPRPGPVSTAPAKGGRVELGIIIFPDVNAAAKSFGGSADVGDQKAEAQTAVDWVNAHGGLAGHRVVPVFFEVSLTSTQPYSVTYQQICSKFTEDHHVVAAILIGNAEAGLPACLNKTRTLLLAHGHYLHTAQDYRALSNLVTTEDAGSDRIARALVDTIVSRGLLKPGESLGLLVMDYAGPQQARDKIIVPAMQARGIKVVSYTIPYPQSTQDISSSASAVSSAELRMASSGVKNVAFMCPGCVSFFMQDAESQSYYPRYLQTSLDTLGALKGKGHGKSLASTVALGWDPIRDVGTYANPSLLAGNPTYQQCRTIEKANIVSDPSLFASVAFCGALLDLYAAANANPVQTLTGPSLVAGFNALGTSHPGAFNFSTDLGPDRHDGTAAYRTMHYDAPCDCLLYDSTANHAFG